MDSFQKMLLMKIKNSGSALVKLVDQSTGSGIGYCCVTTDDDLSYLGGVRRAYDLCREFDRNNEDLPVVVVFTSWDDDPREVFEIQEIVQFAKGFVSYMPVWSRLAGRDESAEAQIKMSSGLTFLASIAFPECNSKSPPGVVHVNIPVLRKAILAFMSHDLDLEDLVGQTGLDMEWVTRAVSFSESWMKKAPTGNVVQPNNGTPERIRRVIGDTNDSTRRYPKPLPPPLARWYCYPTDAGHSVLCILKADAAKGHFNDERLVPVPVRTVMRGHRVRKGYILVDCLYDNRLGLQVPAADEEF